MNSPNIKVIRIEEPCPGSTTATGVLALFSGDELDQKLRFGVAGLEQRRLLNPGPLHHGEGREYSRRDSLRQISWIPPHCLRACFSRPPVFTKRCCKVVSDEFPIFFGNTTRRQRFPKL